MIFRKKGFTLIELLVVIAIIGILASVVLASLNSARDSGGDAAVKANLSNVRAQAEIIYDGDTDYDAVCAANSVTQNAQTAAAVAAADSANGTGSVTCGAPASGAASAWAIAADMPGGGAWCVDSTGVARAANSSSTAYDSDTGGTTEALDDANDVACN